MTTGLVVLSAIAALLLAADTAFAGRPPPPPDQADSENVPLGCGLSALLWILALAIVVGVGPWWHPELALALVPLLLPWALARRVAIPAGMPRLAAVLAWRATWLFSEDRRGGMRLAAALASVRRPAAPPWLDRFVAEQERVQAAGAFAVALVLVEDPDEARVIVETSLDFHRRSIPDPLRPLAADWLCAHAAATGDWAGVRRVVAQAEAASAGARFLDAFAAALDAPADPREPLDALLARTEDPEALSPLLARLSATASPEPHHDDPLTDALMALERFDRAPAGARTPSRIADLAARWDRALAAPQTATWAHRRAGELGRVDGEAVIGALRASAIERLRDALAKRPPLAPPPPGSVLAQAADQRVAELLDDVEAIAEALDDRCRARVPLPPTEELRAYARLRARYDEAVALGGDDVRRLLFPVVNSAVLAHYVWLHNDRGERALSHAINRWALREAEHATDARAASQHARNLSV